MMLGLKRKVGHVGERWIDRKEGVLNNGKPVDLN